MGTYYSVSNTKQEEVASILSDCVGNGNKVLKHSLRGNCLWILLDCNGLNLILLYLMQAPPRGESGWGYRPYDESAHPYYYSCPLSYLAAAPVQKQEWRDYVIAWHAKQKNRKIKSSRKGKHIKSLQIGKLETRKLGKSLSQAYHLCAVGSVGRQGTSISKEN